MGRLHQIERGFTLIEIIIVVLIIGILAAIVIPRFSDASNEARGVALAGQLRHIRDQMNRYKLDHEEAWPDLINDQWAPLTGRSDADGTLNAGGDYGPYLFKAPAHPFTNSTVIAATEIAGNGWIYDSSTGFVTAVGFDEGTLTYTAP